jgi:predicted small secreted protein
MPALKKRILFGSASLNFAFDSIPVNTNTVTVNGAVVGDAVVLGFFNDEGVDLMIWTAIVTGNNTVTITGSDIQGTGQPISGVFRVWVIKP